jgi:hypothetical protein
VEVCRRLLRHFIHAAALSLAASSQISFEMQAAEAQIEPDFGSICEV